MPSFTIYKLHDMLGGQSVEDLDDYIDVEDQSPTVYGPEDRDDFVAKLYVSIGPPTPPAWGNFVRSGFDEVGEFPLGSTVGAVIVVRLKPELQCFALSFGVTGRYLLKQEAWQRGYGLQAALNLIYPRGGTASTGKLVAVDAKRRSGDVIRSRRQATRATVFEAFDVDKLRDLVGGATGKPDDTGWGRRITGTDALHFEAEGDFSALGKLCRDLAAAHDRDDYRDRFSWLDAIRPIYDPVRLSRIEAYLIERLKAGDITDLDLAPSEIIDWGAVVGFRYHFDAYQKFIRPELQLSHYLNGVSKAEGDLEDFGIDYLRRKYIKALEADNHEVHRWSVWRCLPVSSCLTARRTSLTRVKSCSFDGFPRHARPIC